MVQPRARRVPLPATDEQRARAWWASLFATGLTLLGELAYIFIDWQVFPGQWLLPSLRALHVLWAAGLLALLLARRNDASSRLSEGVFTAVALPYLVIFAVAEVAMAGSGKVWLPLTGHRLLMLGMGLLAPTGLRLGGALVGSFALEAVVLWYGLGLNGRLEMPWEPWVTLVWAGAAVGMLAFLLMVPLARALRAQTGRDYLLYILAVVAGGTMAHTLVPPTPGPLIVAEALGAIDADGPGEETEEASPT